MCLFVPSPCWAWSRVPNLKSSRNVAPSSLGISSRTPDVGLLSESAHEARFGMPNINMSLCLPDGARRSRALRSERPRTEPARGQASKSFQPVGTCVLMRPIRSALFKARLNWIPGKSGVPLSTRSLLSPSYCTFTRQTVSFSFVTCARYNVRRR